MTPVPFPVEEYASQLSSPLSDIWLHEHPRVWEALPPHCLVRVAFCMKTRKSSRCRLFQRCFKKTIYAQMFEAIYGTRPGSSMLVIMQRWKSAVSASRLPNKRRRGRRRLKSRNSAGCYEPQMVSFLSGSCYHTHVCSFFLFLFI